MLGTVPWKSKKNLRLDRRRGTTTRKHYGKKTKISSSTICVLGLFLTAVTAIIFLKVRAIEEAYLLDKAFPFFGSSNLDIDNYAPAGKLRFLQWKDGDTPYAITRAIRVKSDSLARERREIIKASIKHTWDGYCQCAFGYDEVQPVTCQGKDRWNGMGTTIVDSLDTLWLVGMKEEFNQAAEWVRDKLDHDIDAEVSVFETTIRSLGGLLSAYDWSGNEMFLEKAWDLGHRLSKAFETLSGIPPNKVNLKKGLHAKATRTVVTNIGNAGTTQLEFRYLSMAINDTTYAMKSENVFEKLHSLVQENGLYFSDVHAISEEEIRSQGKITFGSGADSFYEYMLKQWLQGGRTEMKYRNMYDEAIDGMHEHLLQYTETNGLAYIGKRHSRGKSVRIEHKFQHLECFMGGLLALGAYTDPLGFGSERAQRDMKSAKAITYTCYQMYASTPTGLSPEAVDILKTPKDTKKNVNTSDSLNATHNSTTADFVPTRSHPWSYMYMLRPETLESFYILNKLTGDPIYREWGWEIFQSIEKYCKSQYGYGHVSDVEEVDGSPTDQMESFFLGELMKYLYLLMDPDSEVDLDKHVFTTEAHPMKRFDEWGM